MNTNIVYHYTKTNSAFSIIEPEHQNKLKYLMDNIIDIIKKADIKPDINTDDLIKSKILSQIQKIYNTNFFFCFRASNIENVNDPSERVLGYSYIRKLLLENKKDKSFEEIINIVENRINNKTILDILKQNSYIISFSEVQDNLNQWRLYADNGKGISLGIDKNVLTKIENLPTGIEFLPVLYNESEIIKHIKSFKFNFTSEEKQKLQNENWTEKDIAFLLEFNKILLINSFSSFIKHECYASEKEYRLIVNPVFFNYISDIKNIKEAYIDYFINFRDMEKHFFSTPEKIIAYREIPLPMKALKEVWLGPKHQSNINIVEDYLAKLGYENVKVIKSELPYK